MRPIKRIDLLKLANEYRCEQQNRDHGYVVITGIGGWHVTGWTIDLTHPGNWVPGCYAVDIDGRIYIATGGDDYHGAQEWVPESIRECAA